MIFSNDLKGHKEVWQFMLGLFLVLASTRRLQEIYGSFVIILENFDISQVIMFDVALKE
jgi:hypothetical protein